jgi:hypothetical protein
MLSSVSAVVGMCFLNRIVLLSANGSGLLYSFQKINDAVGPLNRIKDILVAANQPSPGIHGHARASGM